MKKYPPITKIPHMLHGGDYNPDQWINTPEVWDEDMRLMKLAGCNTMSIGIFAWSALEPTEGNFEFGWMDTIMDKLAENGAYAILATPSGARPAWMAYKYPEVLRVDAQHRKLTYGERHNHCYTSPIYREKVNIINTKLAERYKDHPALAMWHISNEYIGNCHCPLCQEAFREFLKVRYNGDLALLNSEYWNGFWSGNISDWSEIEAPSPIGRGENSQPLLLDWKRFITHQTIDFMKHEMAPLRRITPDIPMTTNCPGICSDYDYFELAKEVDVVSWDNYPAWQGIGEADTRIAPDVAFLHDIFRSMRDGQPFMLMESTPSMTNWGYANKLKRPGLHFTTSMQAVAHGSDTVQYFQWRKSRNGSEQFHGAVVDHVGHENTRVFRDVAELGGALAKLDEVVGTRIESEVAIMYDWENKWAIEGAFALTRDRKNYLEVVSSFHRPFWRIGISTDVIDASKDFSKYKVIVAPMLYMLRPGVAKRLAEFVKKGGCLIGTYFTGLVNENNLAILGGSPGEELREVFGVWAEEIDSLYDGQTNRVEVTDKSFGLKDSYTAGVLCELIHAETAQTIAKYTEDFYAGMSALTKNSYGKGSAYYIAFRDIFNFDDAYRGINDGQYDGLPDDLAAYVAQDMGLKRNMDTDIPNGFTVQRRTDGESDFVFVQNYNAESGAITLDGAYYDMLADSTVSGEIAVGAYETKVLRREAR